MITTAYEGYLNREAKEYSPDPSEREHFIAESLKAACAEGNPQAFDIVGRTGDKAYDSSTFIRAAKSILK